MAPATVVQRLIYGTDDRREVFEASAAAQSIARGAIAAIVERSSVDQRNVARLSLRAAPLSAWDDFCAGERFVDEPTAARCAAVLIDDDLVVTAAHCVQGNVDCRDMLFVFDYLEEAPGLQATITRDAIFGCRRIAASAAPELENDMRGDWAVVQLDRPASNVEGAVRHPVPLRASGAVETGERLSVFGFPLGLPLKVDENAVAGDPRADKLDVFALAADTYRFSSGSAVIDEHGQLAGILARGAPDFVDFGLCRASRVADPTMPQESASYAFAAAASLCEARWPSALLCATSARCGDGVCSSDESPAVCADDCSDPVCGDDLCEISESSDCDRDCGDGRPPGIPREWYCDAAWYADGSLCDCLCGTFDPDCGDPGAPKACDELGPGGRQPTAGYSAEGGCAVAAARPRERDIVGGAMNEERAALLIGLAGLCFQRIRRTRARSKPRPIG